MNAIGIDIGTTTICAVAVDAQTGKVLDCVTAENDCKIQGKAYEKLQDPEKIVEKVKALLHQLVERNSPVCCLGFTGQMHGIVYVDERGMAVSALYSWQDGSAAELSPSGKTYAEELSAATGYAVSSGFGIATAYTHLQQGAVPAKAKKICTVHDYVAMRIANVLEPITHASDAASLGCFSIKENRFDEAALKKAGFDLSLLPKIGDDRTVIGSWQGIPVGIAVGDNQASYVGSTPDLSGSLLVNVGTGSQISFPWREGAALPPSMEVRPCSDGQAIAVGASLCGGRAYATLEGFFRQVAESMGVNVCSAYEAMDALLNESEEVESSLKVCVKFCGSRACPQERGSVTGLSLENFTPRDFTLGVLQGIVDELYEPYAQMKPQGIKRFVGAGNGLRKNPTLRKMFEKTFGMPLQIPVHREEAAFGAVLYALVACGKYRSLAQAQSLISYGNEG